MKRLLDCRASDFSTMKSHELKQAIKASEGRTILAEVVSPAPPLFHEITNAELVAAFGADLILLNLFDVFDPNVASLTGVESSELIPYLKKLTGRPIGLNLEPVDIKSKSLDERESISEGRTASVDALKMVKQLGFDFVCLTGNPKTGVSNDEIVKAIERAKNILDGDVLIIAGKMHSSGVEGEEGADMIPKNMISSFIEAGADVLLLPAPGTVPGISVASMQEKVSYAHKKGALTMLTIGTSQEGADEATIRQIGLNNKMAGADIHHIGDAGYTGVAIPENIMTYSITVRGKRHTYIRMAASVIR
ncbi:haloacid dehalogenase-like hydrolase [Salipaludibacillus daqingensis]|uniref:DUF7916 family protein n=1 Tax=Salipaludibacillus daqingensis TaxID=3041001 RepID=UPI002476C658|nr:haloacid dehalogenase-like hydrolase [Salipaludibacillus daqingensis]